MLPFHIRTHPLPSDPPFILSAFDSALPHLSKIGSSAQWGTTPRSTQPLYIDRINSAVETARSGTSNTEAVFIAELPINNDFDTSTASVRIDDNDGKKMLKAGAAVVTGSFPGYVLDQVNLAGLARDASQRGDFIYLSVLVSDFRIGAVRRGAGGVLLQRVKQYAREIGKVAVYLDCWAGNGGGLVR
ncbi:hypothetical protein NX059_007710 [Plenodomus lindquistii]|nr:hypothetical protein NX059_007710 [Plenodomus lindquistii]